MWEPFYCLQVSKMPIREKYSPPPFMSGQFLCQTMIRSFLYNFPVFSHFTMRSLQNAHLVY